jgi:hypothetical protein
MNNHCWFWHKMVVNMQPHIGKRGKRKEGDFGHLNDAFLVLEK